MNLEVEDGDRKLSLDFSQHHNEGPQFAQRRIAEAAVMVHMARAFGVDYQPCIAQEAQATGGVTPARPAAAKAPVSPARRTQG